ncbi:type 2 isopentenyl-diphosphate Delta-isomerase [Aerococcus urinaehominis]|uniref:Isopentenyl-diphosphate delta-isomerase n=1 Tax=Aerococcus urinaehominis TaxID=128944 RepID=A0A109RH93_9LACT|nr:type 2 isopentenyl-diphosphate Delta-isomerase [Aerococcus urinaehominis]AMB99819.1 type 2 isopentenyl-diphosphate Delta-isomerase [Aerococcus urinaehominis]SDM55197.1 isopentenyl-diphosphate delta-isomerase [Aerococcus urinaehominis]
MSIQSQRKDDHVRHADSQYQTNPTDFAALDFVHQSIPRLNVADIDISTRLLGHELASPFYINAMTGGSEWTKQINRMFAELAHETGLAMAAGSLSIAIKDPSTADSFKVIRQANPDGFVLANLGANHNLENAKRAVDILEANALQIHLNTPQEVVMPEGDRDFRPYYDHIQEIVAGLDVPVLVKEVGFGMARETMETLADLGVQAIDVSGRGGTNFALIENARRSETFDMSYLANWGQSTLVSLLEAQDLMATGQVDIVSSGGIKNPLDMVKALALGAKATAMSGFFLHQVLNQPLADCIQTVRDYQDQLRLIMALVNAPDIASLSQTDLVVTGYPAQWAQARGIDINRLANRSQAGR